MWLSYALLAAVCFGLRGILYQWTSKKLVNRNLMLFGVFLLGAIIAPILTLIADHHWTKASLVGIVMGVLSFIANASMYKGYAVGKASLVALFTALPPVVVVCTAYLLWGQTLSIVQFVAFLAILAGILIIRYSADISLNNMKGVHWALIALFAFGLNDTTSTQAMRWEADVFPTMFFMFSTGSFLFGLSWLRGHLQTRNRPLLGVTSVSGTDARAAADEMAATTQTASEWRAWPTVFWGMLVGTTNLFGMYFILHSFSLGKAGLVSAVTALNVLIILIYAGVFLKERFSVKEWIGGLIALAGVMTLHLGG